MNNNCPTVPMKGFAIKGLPIRAPSFHSRSTLATVSAKFVPTGYSTEICSPRHYVRWPNSDAFWTLLNPVSSGSLPIFSSYPRPFTRQERAMFLVNTFQRGHLSLVSQCSGVDSRSIPRRFPLPTFVHWWSLSSHSPFEV